MSAKSVLVELGRFLQPDPKEFAAGDYNLYRYCHNDPINKSDPFGLYARGAGFSDDQWKRFDRAQMDAAAKLEKAIKTGDTKAFAEVFGKKAVTPENMSKLANTMKSMVTALRDHGKLGYTAFGVTKDYFTSIHKPADTIARSLPDGKGLQINVQHSGFNDAYQLSWTAAHESGHPFGLRDHAYKFGGEGQAPGAYQNLTPAKALENADSVVDYAFR